MLLAVLVGSACTKVTVVGNDLLDDGIQDIGSTDTFRVLTTVVKEDSILTHSGVTGSQIIRHVFGKLDDPYLGKTESIIVSQMFLNGIGSEFLSYTVDSVVMTLALDSANNYGATDEEVAVTVTRNADQLDVTESYYSNFDFTKEDVSMGETGLFVPNYLDSITLNGPRDTVTLAPHLRIPMNDNFIDDLTSQTRGTFEFSDSFAMWFPGVHIEMSAGENTMAGINLNNPLSGMTIYYSEPDSNFYRSYQFVFTGLFNSNVQAATFEHDYAGAIAEPFIDNQELSDSLIFLQSLSGLNTEFSVRGLEDFDNVLINQATLEFYVADLADVDISTYPLLERMQTKVLFDSTVLINSIDLNLALSVNDIDLFGGALSVDNDGRLLYSMNITAGIQDIVQGRAPNKIFLSSYLKQNNPRRLVLYGPGHPDFPAKLRLTFTRVQ